MVSKKFWTLEEAKKIFPEIYRITEFYYNQYEALQIQLNDILPELEQEKVEEKIEKIINIWILQMIDYQVEVKGLWLVDFDNGKGYYCWKYPENDILYEHDYISGYAGRKLIIQEE